MTMEAVQWGMLGLQAALFVGQLAIGRGQSIELDRRRNALNVRARFMTIREREVRQGNDRLRLAQASFRADLMGEAGEVQAGRWT